MSETERDVLEEWEALVADDKSSGPGQPRYRWIGMARDLAAELRAARAESDARRASLAQEIRECLTSRGLYVSRGPESDLIRDVAAALDGLRAERDALRAEVEGYKGWARSVNEALNSGDGSYRP